MDVFEKIARDRFAMDAGCRLLSCGKGEAVLEIEAEERHLNGVGLVQGGLIFTLADTAFAAAANSDGRDTVSLSSTVSFLRPARSGTLTARAVTVSRGRTTCCIEVSVTDGDGRLIAKMQGTGYTVA